MKKILAICLMMVMVVSMSVTAFAAPKGFVSSPSGNPAPQIITFKPSNADCVASLVITSYAEKNTLSADRQKLLDQAYASITETNDLTTLNADFAELVANKKIPANELAVSDIFDTDASGCDVHEGHEGFKIVLKADTLDNFVGLLQMHKNGKWELVSNAKVTNNGEYLEFTVDSLSAFAIVVDTTSYAGTAPQTSGNYMIYVCAVLMAASVMLFVFVVIKRKKQRS